MESALPLTDGLHVSADDTPAASQTVINWMVDGPGEGSVRVRPGISNATLDPGRYTAVTGTSTGIIGTYVWVSAFDGLTYLIYVRQDRTIWAKNLITNAVAALSSASPLTQLSGSSVPVFAEDSLRVVISGGGSIQQWTGVGLSSRLGVYVAGVNQPPPAASHVVSIGNYLVANNVQPGTNNQIFWSNLGDGAHASWNPLNFNTADADADAVVALGTNMREIVAFGAKTLQVFGLTSDATLPFASAASLPLGCGAAHSIVRRDNDYAWLDDTRRIVAGDGRSYNVLSDNISKGLRDLSTVSDCIGFRARLGYWDLLLFIFPAAQRAFAYDQARRDWREWRGWDGMSDYAGIRISCYAPYPSGNMHIVGDPLYENLWTLDDGEFSDTGPGQPIVAELVTSRLDWSSVQRKRTKRVRFFAKRGNSLTTASEPAFLDVAKRDDDRAWSGLARINLGTEGDYASFRDWYPGGIYHRRQFRIRYSGGVDTSLSRAVEQWTPYGEEAA